MSLPSPFKATWFLRLFAMTKIPMLAWCWPKVISLDEKRSVVQIPLNFRTKNHLGSMYFAVLAAGADCAGGLSAMMKIQASGRKISLIFADFKAEFLKRAEGDVQFVCEAGDDIQELMRRTLASTERQNLTVLVTAKVPSRSGDEPIARFWLTLSLKLLK